MAFIFAITSRYQRIIVSSSTGLIFTFVITAALATFVFALTSLSAVTVLSLSPSPSLFPSLSPSSFSLTLR